MFPYDLTKRWLPCFELSLLLLPSAMAQSAWDYGLIDMERMDDSTFIDRKEVSVADMMAFALEDSSMAMPDPDVARHLPYGSLFYGVRSGSLRKIKGWTNTRVTATVPKDSVATKTQRFRAERYMDYPIAGISYEQAMAYCAWMTRQERPNQRVDGEVVFELPTPEELERLLNRRDSTGEECPTFNYGCQSCHPWFGGKEAFLRPGSELTPVDGYNPDSLGLYNLRGNAAEMTSTPGLAKGGSYVHPAREASPQAVQYYHKPEPWLGFRCVARIRKG